MGLINWAVALFTKAPEIDTEVIVLEEVKEKSLYPQDCTNARRKIEFLYRAQEILRQLHNTFVAWREDGISEVTWAGFPVQIRDMFPYRFRITPEIWKRFHDEEFMPRSGKICNEITIQRAEFKASADGSINIGEI